ncbi:MAG: ABC transporter permease [Chloroflexi bacterium HGW-Chloroflexi-1]|nr:MAG: ABC transporter permease [Chloroflexi bacterium HGW-Chloroflexi-1]
MSLRRIGVLLEREVVRGPKNFLFIFTIAVPLVLTLVVNLVFGSFFSGKPKMGIADQGDSQFVTLAHAVDSIILKEYATDADLKRGVEYGAVDLGLILPAGFDVALAQGQKARVTAYVWGESMLKNRAVLGTTISVLLRQMLGQDAPVEIVTETVGDGENVPWQDRLLPLVVMMTVLLGGIMVPATSLINEKLKRTLRAITTTPATIGEVLTAKGLLGGLLSLVMGVLILLINRAFGIQPLLLVALLALGAIMAATIGVLLGALVKDIDTLFATIKSLGIILYAPAIVYMFPEIPQWIGRIFPTYYMIAPIMEITQRGGAWPDVALETVILVVLVIALIAVAGVVGPRIKMQEA